MGKGTLQIHSENILPIIKKWLYTEKDIFVRELISNACDACQKLKFLSEQGQAQANSSNFRIDVTINSQEHTLTFSDNGIGMDAEEVEKYIAQIAFSGAEEFVKSYQTNNLQDQFIGHFGLGFYSAYMVAEKVSIQTLSYKEDARPVYWCCDGSSSYEIGDGSRQERGTDVILHIDKENSEYLSEDKMRQLLKHYCAFLPYPIYLNGNQINTLAPLWTKNANECSNEEYLQFYRQLFPFEEDPLFWIHLNVDYPFHLRGILYFPKIRKDFDWQKSSVKLFCNRVFVAGDCKDILPDYLNVLKGAIDSPDIPLNVSRSALQVDKTVRQIGQHVAKKVSDSLGSLYKTDKEKFYAVWEQASLIVKLGILQDDKFYEKAKDFLIWKTTDSNWMTIEEYETKNSSKTESKIYYTSHEQFSKSILDLYTEQGVDVLIAPTSIDTAVMALLERKNSDRHFHRIDASIDKNILDPSREKTLLDTEGKSESARIAEFIQSCLDRKVEVEAKSLTKDSLPALITIKEQERRFRDYMMRMSEHPSQDVPCQSTFIVNTNSPLVQGIIRVGKENHELAKKLVYQLYDLALLSQQEMPPKDLNNFLTRSQELLENMVQGLAEIKK